MTSLFITSFLTLCILGMNAQKVENINDRKPGKDWENIDIEKIADDSLCTSFLIWIKAGVKHHFHVSHTECIYVLEGEGLMVLGESEFLVKTGDYVQIPKGIIHSVQANIPMHVLSIQTPQFSTDDRVFVSPIKRL